jgi:hypothetical protein
MKKYILEINSENVTIRDFPEDDEREVMIDLFSKAYDKWLYEDTGNYRLLSDYFLKQLRIWEKQFAESGGNEKNPNNNT